MIPTEGVPARVLVTLRLRGGVAVLKTNRKLSAGHMQHFTDLLIQPAKELRVPVKFLKGFLDFLKSSH